jgi:hypothetical protein
MYLRGSIVALSATLLATLMWAQSPGPTTEPAKPDPANFDTLNFATKLGSFRAINGAGRLEFSFRGTVLVSKLDGNVTMTGNVKEEYKDEERTVYHGTGRCVVEGQWRAVQWFGRDMTAKWHGQGIARVTGDFDANQETGWYWYDDPSLRIPWPAASSRDVFLPEPGYERRVPRVRPSDGS